MIQLQAIEHAIKGIERLMDIQRSGIARLNRSIELQREYTHVTAQEREDNLARLLQQKNKHEVELAKLESSLQYYKGLQRRELV